MEALHTCEPSAMSVQAICEDGSVGSSDIFILVAAILVLTGLGVVIWQWTRRRFQE